ncbi:MAG: ATP-dependent DNA helicase PcrA [Ruminococcaceae bacterium]|nr:ATP-dependent DNA helicase PcrA [Oscillospiraceae bacterium]
MTQQMMNRFLTARRKYIAGQFSDLNPMQQQAALTTEGPLLLLAGAGSGKTTVLINRIANLMLYGCGSDPSVKDIPDTVTEEDVLFLEQLGEEATEFERHRADYLCAVRPAVPWSIIAITFTNKAAGELKERLAARLGDAAQDVWAMTFHSACCRILRKDIERLGYSRSFTIYDTDDSARIMKEILKDMGLDDKTFPAKYVLGIISKEKDRMITPDMMLERAEEVGDLRILPIAKAYKKYQKKLKENNAVDFDDIILLTVKLLQENEDIRTYYQRKFRYVLVDEYQDTNHLQYLLTSLLAGGYENICVVGDDDQSIYRFRGATIENILDFEKQYHSARVIRLEQNYRSTQAILNAANSVIVHNRGRKGKRLWTANGAGQPVTVYEASDERSEAKYIANQILKNYNGRNLSDFAILYRTNAQSNAIEQAFKIVRTDKLPRGIPYRVIGGTRFFDRAEIKDMLAYLCVINNRTDDLRLNRIINNPPRGLGAKSIETAQRLADAEGLPLYEVLAHPGSYAPLEKIVGKLKAFTTLIDGLETLLDEGMSLPEFYEELMLRTGYVEMLQKKETEENKTRLENVRELKSSILAYVENAEMPTLAGFLEEIALYTDIEEYNDGDDAVVMMTMHASKGLEFPHVFLVGFEDGLFPGMKTIGDMEEMEEERRLCYVAITRAKHSLTITHARQRMLYGRTTPAMGSRFLRELPQDEILKKGGFVAPTPRYDYHDTEGYYPRPAGEWKAPKSAYVTKPAAPSKPIPEFNKGDMVSHAAFGRGMVLSVMKMGGDALLEIAFDQIGTKKLMARTASAHMKKL